jgi:MATE family multidrug resistance protein
MESAVSMKSFRPERARLMHEMRATVRLALPLILPSWRRSAAT